MKAGGVFINCPFSADYAQKFNAIVFAVIRSGFTPRCAREAEPVRRTLQLVLNRGPLVPRLDLGRGQEATP